MLQPTMFPLENNYFNLSKRSSYYMCQPYDPAGCNNQSGAEIEVQDTILDEVLC